MSICFKTMWKKSHAPLLTLFVYFTHLVPPTGLFWTIFCPAIQDNLVSLPFSPICCPAISAKKCPSRWWITVSSKQKWKPPSPIETSRTKRENESRGFSLKIGRDHPAVPGSNPKHAAILLFPLIVYLYIVLRKGRKWTKHSTHLWLLGRSGCSYPFTKKLHTEL